MSSSVEELPKKKRRQNVACDVCKLRRVKCDLLELLQTLSNTESLNSLSTEEPPHLLVRRHPGVSCTNCRNKGIQCSTEGILNPIKPNKGGRRIQEAREKFGAERTGDGVHPHPLGGDESARNTFVNENGQDAFFFASHAQATTDASYNIDQDICNNSSSGLWQQLTNGATSFQQSSGPPDHLSDAVLADIESQLFPGRASSTMEQPASSIPIPIPFQAIPADVQLQARRQWEEFSVNTPRTIANRSARSSPLPTIAQTQTIQDLDGHNLPLNTIIPALGRLDIETNQFLPVLPAHAAENRAIRHPSPRGQGSDRQPDPHDQSIRDRSQSRLPTPRPTPSYSGKRYRSRDSVSEGVSPTTSTATTSAKDPWHIWQDPGEQSMVIWSRKNQVQESLADRALGVELSRHLVTVYFQAVHFSLPVLSPESFYLEWEACGRRSDRMNPSQEALCAVIEAWAARYSDHPAILALPYQKAHTAPKVITAAGQFAPGTQARAHWGKARLPVCNALLDRAGRIIDANAIMRRPSVTGIQALALYNQLMHMSDQGSRVKDQWIENMMVHSTVVEQMKLLHMLWTAGDPILTADDSDTDALQMRMKQRRLFWTTAVSDSCWAAATGMTPKMPEEELTAGRAWVDEVVDSLPDSTMKVLAFFMKIWHRLAMVGREVAARVTKYNDRKGNIPVVEFCASVRLCWTELRSITTELNESAVSLLGSCELGVLGFSPLNYMTNMRLCCPFFLLVLHEAIRNHLAFRQSLWESYIVETDTTGANRRSEELALLDKLHLQSVDVLLYNCRSQMALFKTLLPTGILQSASAMVRVLIASGQFLAEVPTNEQGYPVATLGGCGWTWEEKQRVVSVCSDALYQIGWAWSDVTAVLEAMQLAMERMTPDPEILAAYTFNPPPINVKIQSQQSRESRIEDQGIQSALRFWPPQSIPNILSTITASQMADEPLGTNGIHDSRSSSSTPLSGSSTSSVSYGFPFRQSLDHVEGIESAPTTFNGIPGFDTVAYDAVHAPSGAKRARLGQALFDDPPPLPSDIGQPSTSQSTTPFDASLVNAACSADEGDQYLWDLLNGSAGQKNEIDLTSFLQNFDEV